MFDDHDRKTIRTKALRLGREWWGWWHRLNLFELAEYAFQLVGRDAASSVRYDDFNGDILSIAKSLGFFKGTALDRDCTFMCEFNWYHDT